jgi:GTP-binding protein
MVDKLFIFNVHFILNFFIMFYKNMIKVAIVGRPNVGKSALFNRICKKRISIVDEQEGVTRDRLYAEAEIFGKPFLAIDTGGIDPKGKQDFNALVREQALFAIHEADSIILVVDAKCGPTALDHEVADLLLKTQKKITLAINKMDCPENGWLMAPFHALGITNQVAVSAVQNWQIAELLEAALAGVEAVEVQNKPTTKVAIVGKTNVGKSTLVNSFLSDPRCIVSPIAGTTRDSIDIPFSYNGSDYTLIDTAGIRHKGSEHDVVDKFAAIRTKEAIERSDLCLLVLDSTQGITQHEKRIAKMIEEQGKGCILLFNKWDLVKGFRMEHCMKGIEDQVPFLHHAPKLFISALSGRNLEKVFPIVDQVFSDSQLRISTGQLNHFVESAVQNVHPPMMQGRRLRIYYLTQVSVHPPKFILFVNHPDLMTDAYRKYLQNQFRQSWRFSGVPITFHLKRSHQKRERI